ncbi:MAG: mutS2, partial [Clostridia bacterium]|nr:mutS2 [Clostridia bacterium]
IFLLKYGTPSFMDMKDITNACRRSESGAILSIKELLEIGNVLKIARNLYDYLEKICQDTCFDKYYKQLMPNKYFEDKIFNAFPGEEEISDNASPALHDIRRKQMQAKNKIRSVLDSFLHSSVYQKYLQESIITIRNDRYVIPVKAEYRQEINGLVHDTSSSGATLFIEPMQVVSANNDLSVLASQERQEIERILQDFSIETGSFSDNIISNFKTARFFDFCFAKARYAEKLRAHKPILNKEGFIDLRQARHPLIEYDKVVPIDVSIGKKYSALIITGPNTGGKTVTLKTIGLICLMAKSGLFISAKDQSYVAFYDKIFADIGDEQSIEQSLSTFSSHMSNIVEILKNVNDNSLVLLDELGSGTDPSEGAALAIALIEHILSMGAKLVTTTHYAELKLYAIQTLNVENASCEFDVATLKPTYKLIIGIPGKSNAFAIASRLGVDDIVIETAKYHLNNETVNVERVLADLEISRKNIEHDAQVSAELKKQAEELLRKNETERNNLKASANTEIEKARKQALEIVERAKRDTQRLLDEIDDLRKEKDRENFREKIQQKKADIKGQLNKSEMELVIDSSPIKKPLPRPLKAGDNVKIVSIGKSAVVLDTPDQKGFVYLQAGIIKTKINIDDLELLEHVKVKHDYKPSSAFKVDKGSRDAKLELDIRGMTALEADGLIDDYLNNSSLSGLKNVSIIHGKGTGALRAAVHEMLKRNPMVESFRLGVYGEGETGVTIITLK